MSDLNAIEDIKIGDHICSFYGLSLAAIFLKLGLENWEKCLYIGNEQEIYKRLEKIGIGRKYLETRQLSLIPKEIMPLERLALLRENLEFAIKEGYRCLRVAQEMTPCEELMEYEAKLNEFYSKNPALGLCLYERKLFEREILLRAVKTHPKVYAAGMVCENPHFMFPLEKDAGKELQAYIGILLDNAILKRQFARCKIRSDEILKERTKKMQDNRDAIFNMLKDMDESYKKLQKAYEELETLDKMKDEFLSNVSHELKTPLVSIKGYSELMRDDKLGSLSKSQADALDVIIRNADRLTRLINSILFLSIVKAGKVEFKFEPVDIRDIIETSFLDFGQRASKKGLMLGWEVAGKPQTLGDREKLVEVLVNLLDNAVKFTPKGGEIKVKAWGEPENLHIIVADTGIGIPKEAVTRLFQRFYQVDASITRKYGGTGLGLYICKSIIDSHHGKIWIESEAGRGTTVHILLPSAKRL
jgi:signal transduction histidine kinase